MIVRAGAKTDIGRSRERNEDSLLVRAPLYAVADGMGGHRGGNVASAMALETLQEVADSGRLNELVEKVKQANVRVMERGESERDLQGMGTTLTAMVADGSKAHLVHIGDSRAYLLRDGAFQQLTRDHTLVQRMVDEGRLTREEADHHPQRSILTKALGVEREAEPDPLTLDLSPGDRVILCTDGLTGMIDVDRIQAILEDESDPQAAAELLVDAANAAGGEDNITVIVLDFEEDGEGSEGGAASAMATGAPGARGDASSPPGPQASALGPSSSGTAVAQDERPPSETAVVGRAPTGPHAEPSQVRTEETGRPRSRRKIVLWSVIAVAILAAAGAGASAYIDHQWYVGDAGGRVAIYNGIPTKVVMFDLGHVKETTTLSSSGAERLAPWRGLRDGITADSLSEARSIVDQIRRDLQGTKATGG